MACLPQAAVDPQVLERPVPSLRTNFKWTLVGNLVYSLCQWAMLSVLAKAGNAGIVGQFALGLAVAAPVFMFANLQLRAVQATDARREYRFADYFTLRILTTLAGLAVIAGIVLSLRSDHVTRGVILLVALAKCIECVSDVIGGLLQLHERLDQVAISLMIRGMLSILVFGATFLISHSLIACTAAMCLAWLTVLLAYDVQRAKAVLIPGEPWLHIDWRVSRTLALLSLPLGFVMMLISLNVNIPRYLLEHYSGPADLGIFASLAYLLVVVSMIVNALGQSATVRLASMFAGRNFNGFRSLIFKLIAIGVGLLVLALILAALFGRIALTLLYRPEYGDHVGLFLVMVASAGVSAIGSFLGYGMTAARCLRSQVPLTAACTVTSAAVTALLVPHFGSIGAALGLLASALVFVAGAAFLLTAASRKASRACN
jgi:O-antigen/teichoic acid export membrane protein